jgi:hypothetical protein
VVGVTTAIESLGRRNSRQPERTEDPIQAGGRGGDELLITQDYKMLKQRLVRGKEFVAVKPVFNQAAA